MEPGENIAARRHTWPEARVSPTEDAGCYRPWPPQKVTVIGEEHSARPDEIRDLLTIPSKLRADSGHLAIDDGNGRTAQLVRARRLFLSSLTSPAVPLTGGASSATGSSQRPNPSRSGLRPYRHDPPAVGSYIARPRDCSLADHLDSRRGPIQTAGWAPKRTVVPTLLWTKPSGSSRLSSALARQPVQWPGTV